MVELAMVMTLGLVLLGISIPKVSKAMAHTRVNKAAAVLATDLRQGFELALRARKPIRMTYTAATYTVAFADRATGTVIRQRAIGPTSEFRLTTITFSPTQIEFFPSGLSSGILTVTLGANGYTRQVRATSAGLVRTLP